MGTKKMCEVEGCGKLAAAFGLCYRHYREKYGVSLYGKEDRKGRILKPNRRRGDVKVQPEKTKMPVPLAGLPKQSEPPKDKPQIIINFGGCEDILEQLIEWAKADFRTPDAEILWLLSEIKTKGLAKVKIVEG